jgi:arylformamidase
MAPPSLADRNALQVTLMEIFDVSVPLRTGMPVYPGDPEVRLERVRSSPAVSRLDFGVHTGTHVDAPVHFIEGASGADQLPLDVLNGPCEVVEGAAVALRLLVKNSAPLDGAAARAVVEHGVRLIGVDRMSVGDEEAHRVLLGAGVVIVEGLDLSGVEPGSYDLWCLPLKLVGSDGAPARAILVRR